MDYKKYNIKGVDVYFIKTDKFKTITVDALFINDYDKKNFTINKLLSNYLCRSTNKFKSEVKLQRELLRLYDLDYSIFNMYLNINIKACRVSFLNEKFTEKGMNQKSLEFFFDLIYNPNIDNESFDKENFDLSKKRLETLYKRQLENSSYLASRNACYLVSNDIPLKYESAGNIKDLKKITPKSLYNFYNEFIKESDVKIFAIGDFDDNQMLEILKKYLKENKNKDKYKIEGYKFSEETKTPIEKIDESNYSQSIFILIYKILNITEREKKYVLSILNEILGGSNSKLFRNVREKNSLAYYIDSMSLSLQSSLIIESGISKDNYEKAKKITLEQIEELKKGNITDEELNSAKERIRSSITKTEDSMSRIINTFEDIIIYGKDDNVEFLRQIDNVTKEEIQKLAHKLNLDVSYLFKGVNE